LALLTGALHVEHLALTIVDDLIGRFNLIQERFYLGKGLTAGCVLWIGANDVPGSGKFLCKFATKKRVVLGRLGHNFGIWLSSVQGAEPTFKRKTPPKPEVMRRATDWVSGTSKFATTVRSRLVRVTSNSKKPASPMVSSNKIMASRKSLLRWFAGTA
jgi:hypothetical protein